MSNPPAKNVRRQSSAPPSSNSVAPVSADREVVAKHTASRSASANDSRAMRVLRAIVGLTLVIGIGTSVVWGARRYVRTSARFAVGEIITSGGKRRGPEDIASIANVTKGQNIFSIDLDRSRARLTADPWIQSAELTRQLPNTISIRVIEREAAGIVALAAVGTTMGTEGTYLVTRDGAIIKRLEPGDPLDYHVVTGVTLKALTEDREGATRTIRFALDLAYDYDRCPLAQRSPIEEVHVEPNGDMTLIVGKSGVVVRMGGAPYRRKLDQAVRIVAELDRRGAKPDTIMLDDEARPERVVVRMR